MTNDLAVAMSQVEITPGWPGAYTAATREKWPCSIVVAARAITLNKAAMRQRFIQVAGEGPGGSIAGVNRSVYTHKCRAKYAQVMRRPAFGNRFRF